MRSFITGRGVKNEVKGLSALFKKVESKGLMKGVVFGLGDVHVLHLQFADDTILFLQLKIEYLMNVRRILRCFELASGLRINFQKTCVVKFGKGRFGREEYPLWKKVICGKYGVPLNALRWNWNGGGCLSDHGNWIDDKWSWEIPLSRQCFGWEIDQWTSFITSLQEIRIYESTSDTIGWNLCSNGLFTVNSFWKSLGAEDSGISSVCSGAWQVDMVKFGVAWWFKNNGKGSSDPITLILLDIAARCADPSEVKVPKIGDWIPPPSDVLKFNVDGSARGSPGHAGIGGVLRDSRRQPHLKFLPKPYNIVKPALAAGKFCAPSQSASVGKRPSLQRLWRLQKLAEILDPAVKGMLHSCKKSRTLRRVFLTSSSAAGKARDDFDPTVPLDESSWSSVDLCEKLQAAWEFCDENGIDLVTILPSFIVGPSLPPELSSTASEVLGLLKGETGKFLWHGRIGYVHIDDVALCHILIYEHKDCHGRYICSSTVMDNDEMVSLLSSRYPLLPLPQRFEKQNIPYYEFNTSKLTSLGFKFKSVQEMFDDGIASFVKQGYLSSVQQ
ncbi:hypothetical protein Dsin_023386 [Dipteronia sinensis]|uniref:NAD-dependent epimerase/dehydratase domain-containing protein n=1 Tax=Dipteronia sinensis TaxID=43782 RepID=A0AAE0A4U2_9ROSI|nr:hypothetical protein Dsin_023386 [Dipteronia sinensis]